MAKENGDLNTADFEVPYFWSNEERLVAAVYRGYLVASPIIDSVSNWILVVAGASFAVAFGQLDKLDESLKRGIMGFLYWLIAAAVFTFVQKLGAISVSAALASASRVNRVVNQLGAEKLQALDWDLTDREVWRPLHWPWSRIAGGMARGGTDNLMALRYAVRWVQIQGAAATLEAVAILGGILSLFLRAR